MNLRELDIALTFIQQHPSAAARELELQPQDVAVELIQAVPLHQGGQLIAHMLPHYAARLCAQLSPDLAAGLLAGFNANQAAAILRAMSKAGRNELLKALPEKLATLCRLLLSYSDDSVGAWMSADVFMLPAQCQVAQALKRFSGANGSTIGDALAVVDNQHALVGLVSLRDLLCANPEASIVNLGQEIPPVLSSRISLATAARHEGWQHYDVLPVVNRNKQLTGLLRHVELRRGLAQFSETSQRVVQDDLVSNMGQAYIESLVALLGLIDNQAAARPVSGEGV